ncbi:hypothetical protein XENTR_v10004890 [Xenopus tropicalis]|nr:hypothetical protein XENTR_v10004890 [Xenopus tropicalis]
MCPCCPPPLLLLLSLSIPVFGRVPEPQNVRMDSVNFKNILRWDPPVASGSAAYTYTAEYRLALERRTNYTRICHTNATHCDFSNINYNSIVRVRAERNGGVSKWVTRFFNPYSQTVITAPEVKVASRAGYLDVSFFGPMEEADGRSLTDKYGNLKYKLFYWRQSEPSVVTSMESSQNLETLADLEKWTSYCIRVQAYAPDYNNTGELSEAICEKTTNDGTIPGWQIALSFIVPLCLSAVIVVGMFYLGISIYKAAKYLFFPKYSFPEHLKEVGIGVSISVCALVGGA